MAKRIEEALKQGLSGSGSSSKIGHLRLKLMQQLVTAPHVDQIQVFNLFVAVCMAWAMLTFCTQMIME